MDPQFHTLQVEIAAAVAGLSPEQLSQHPPGKWCPGEILEHLYLTYTGTVKGFQRVLDAGKSLTSKPTWKQRGGTFVVVGLGYFPSGRETPAVARPRGLPPEKVLAEIGPKIAEMDDLITLCERKLGSGCRLLDHPVLGPLSASQWRKFHLVHGRHHVKQLHRLRQSAAHK